MGPHGLIRCHSTLVALPYERFGWAACSCQASCWSRGLKGTLQMVNLVNVLWNLIHLHVISDIVDAVDVICQLNDRSR